MSNPTESTDPPRKPPDSQKSQTIPLYNFKKHYHHRILVSWYNLWKNLRHNKLGLIKCKPSPWSFSNRNSRYKKIILSSLRIRHTKLTQCYLLQGLFASPSCHYCNENNVSVDPFFSDLPFKIYVPSTASPIHYHPPSSSATTRTWSPTPYIPRLRILSSSPLTSNSTLSMHELMTLGAVE